MVQGTDQTCRKGAGEKDAELRTGHGTHREAVRGGGGGRGRWLVERQASSSQWEEAEELSRKLRVCPVKAAGAGVCTHAVAGQGPCPLCKDGAVQ